jgi:hypothetical protein
MNNARWIMGLVASVLVALAGQADKMPHPWDNILSVGGIIATAVTGYMVQRPRDEWTPEQRQTKRRRDKSGVL